MTGLIVVVVIVLAVLGFVLIMNRSERTGTLSKKEKEELVMLRGFKRNLTTMSMQHAVSDPFAQIVLDEIMTFDRQVEGKQ